VLYCFNNQLTTLDVSNNASLTTLDCSGNQLTALDVSNNPALHTLFCDGNRLRALDVSSNTALQALICEENRLTALDLGGNRALTSLSCDLQDASPLNITSSGNTSYPYQLDFSTYMTSAQIANVSNVMGRSAQNVTVPTSYTNGIAYFAEYPVNVTYNYATGHNSRTMGVTVSNTSDDPVPTGVEINAANFPDATFRSYVSSEFDTDGDDVLSDAEIAAAVHIDIKDMDVYSLKGVEYFTSVVYFICDNTMVTEIDLSGFTRLYEVSCEDNPQLTYINVSGRNVDELYCNNNQLTAMNLSNTTARHLRCSNNQLTSLDLTTCKLKTLECNNNRLMTLDIGNNNLDYEDSRLVCHSQDVSSPFRVSGTGNTSYPYQLDLNSYMTSAQLANVSDVQGVNESGSNISTIYSNGIAQFTARPSRVRYNYNTGYNSTMMDVTAAVNVVEYVNPTPPISGDPTPSHDARILELLRLGYLDDSYRPRITFGGDGSDFTGAVRQGSVITRTVSLRFSAQTWSIYVNGQRVKVSGGSIESTALADGITITPNADGTSATITIDTKEFQRGDNSIQLGVLPEDGTEETALVDLGTVTVNPDVEQAIITPVVLSDEVIQRLAESVSVDVREIIMLTSADIDPNEAPEPTQAMKDIAQGERYELVAKLNTIKVNKEGWYVFKVTVSDDLVGTPVSDLRLYAADESDFAAGSFRSAFGLLPLINGVAGGFEVHNLLGIKLDTLPKQFLALMLLSAGKSLTMYIGKILLMLLAAGCAATSGLGVIAAVVIFAVKRFKKRR
ncbi:MAG: leucine-rich repeat domain-containing protein, partial [Synergistaceae bacterium]|nr:leucine-rich repeat domain-containing protein [Synergistaceae bacterium]